MKLIKTILIEDDSKKIEDIREFITNQLGCNTFTIRESYQSGIKELMANDYDLLLLDMSIPTFDKSPEEIGGPYEKFGGYKILKEIKRKGHPVKTILITMFDDFGESDLSITLNQINETLKVEFSNIYLGSVFYHARENKWQEDLRIIIQERLND